MAITEARIAHKVSAIHGKGIYKNTPLLSSAFPIRNGGMI
jgi:hypothetical protein